MGKTKERDQYKMRPIQLIGWSGRAVSLACNVIVLGYLTYFCTDFLNMDPVLVGTLMMASKLFDGVTDMIAGFIIDKTNTKLGKARPYEFSIIGVWLCTVLLYACPELGTTGKAIWIFVMYTLTNSIFATLLNGSESVYLSRAFKYESDRTKLVSYNGLLVTLFAMVLSIIFPQLMAVLGTTRRGWIVIALITAIPLSLIGILRFIFVKEVAIEGGEKAQTIGLKDFVAALKGNKYIWILCGICFAINLQMGLISGVQTYYFQYVVGDIGALSILSMMGMVGMLALLIMPKIADKISIRRLLIIAGFLAVISYMIRVFAGANMVLLAVSSLVSGIVGLPASYYMVMLVIDIMDYNEWKNGVRVEGAYGSVQGFANKMGAGIASGMVGIIMGMTGYNGALEVQPAGAMNAIVGMYSWIPALVYVVAIVLLFKFDLDDKMPQIRKELDERRAKGDNYESSN